MKIFVRSSLLQVLALTAGFAPVAQAQLVERPLITARHAVVTSDEPLASMAGMRILQEGGNAFDAAVATAVAVGVLDPRMSSIGGNGFATIYVGKTREVRALNFYGSAPKRHAMIAMPMMTTTAMSMSALISATTPRRRPWRRLPRQ